MICHDPDADYFHILREGVPLGISSAIPPCPVMHPPAAPGSAVIPLQHCESAWKSALDHGKAVSTAGTVFIAPEPGARVQMPTAMRFRV